MYIIENYQNEHFEEGKKWTGEYSQDFTNWALRHRRNAFVTYVTLLLGESVEIAINRRA